MAGLLASVVVLAVVLASAWLWTDSSTSLAVALRQSSRWLPAGQTLEATDVTGTLRQGGHIGLLRWKKDGLTVEARDIDLVWQPAALLDRRLKLDSLQIRQLAIDDQAPATVLAPLESLVLPFRFDVAFVVDAFSRTTAIAQAGNFQASALAGHYAFDGERHSVSLDRGRLANGSYRLNASLGAAPPMALTAQLQGTVDVQIPGGNLTLPLEATASVQGHLAGANAAVELKAQVQPPPLAAQPVTRTKPAPVQADAVTMRATVAAQIKPWLAQPVVTLDATFRDLDLAMLWPSAPQTRLTGSTHITPTHALTGTAVLNQDATQWNASVTFTNSFSGPWNTGRAPIDSAQAAFTYQGGQWRLKSGEAAAAGGQVVAHGQFSPQSVGAAKTGNTRQWQVQATLKNVNPAGVHTGLSPTRLDGQMSAHTVDQAIEFDASLQTSAGQSGGSLSAPLPRPAAQSSLAGTLNVHTLRLQSAAAQGRYSGFMLNLQRLNITSSDAVLTGAIDLNLNTQAASGQLHLALPGGQAKLNGQLGAQAGAGDFSVTIVDASLAARWVSALPGAPALPTGYSVKGQGDWVGSWAGGWNGSALRLRSRLQVPLLDVVQMNSLLHGATSPGQPLQIRNVQLEQSGTLAAFSLTGSGQAVLNQRRFDLQTQATGTRLNNGHWHAVLGATQLQARDGANPGVWTAQITKPVTLDWVQSGTARTLQSSALDLVLGSPRPGTAALALKPIRWSVDGARTELKTQGQFEGLPMGWLELLDGAPFAKLGLRGDLVFDGTWDVQAADTLKANATLVRRSGDLSVQADPLGGASSASRVNVGVKDLTLSLASDNGAIRLSAHWDSERAGQAQADFGTTMTRTPDGWQWAPDAPLAGSVKAQLPQMGVWSLLAPPGWRILGTLDANLALAGTRRAPQWSGSLNADNLALRSIAEGIEFSNGRLRSTVTGQRLEIQEFSLRGASGGGVGDGSGGMLNAKGFAQWTADGTGEASSLSKIRVELTATAQALRVAARADRRLALSGNLAIKLSDTKLQIKGALAADQALFILPDETTPSLGSDVVVRSSQRSPANPLANSVAPAPGQPSPNPASAPALASTPRLAMDIAVTLNMGPDFRVQGRGLATRLTGSLELTNSGASGDIPKLVGVLRTINGNYKAYGQQLDIEEGLLRFSGPFDNPSLDILAIRPNLAVRVGVQISGTALSPSIRLFAEPDMAESEKLAWLVLGRSAANGGAESAVLQQAAMALLGGGGRGLSGGLANALGLDELSFRGASTNADGSTSTAAVTLGKRISRNFYVAYERSVAGTLGTVYIFYDLSKRFTLRAQTGEQSAIDLIFTLQYD